MRTRKAFTLIELLVVISIIALLIAILLPVLGNARRSAMDTQCKAGIRSLGQGYHSYLVDSKERFLDFDKLLPGYWNSPMGGSRRNPVALIEQSPLIDYLSGNREEVLICPVFKQYVESQVADRIPENGVSYSYVVNGVLDPMGKTSYKPYAQRPLTVGSIHNATAMAMFMEENPWKHPIFSRDPMNDGRFVINGWPNQDTLGTFHNPGSGNYGAIPASAEGGDLNTGQSHVVFIDNHVDLTPTTLSEYVAYGGDKQWANQPDNWP